MKDIFVVLVLIAIFGIAYGVYYFLTRSRRKSAPKSQDRLEYVESSRVDERSRWPMGIIWAIAIIVGSLLVYEIIIPAGTPTPTLNPADVRATARAAGLTRAAQTSAATPTDTPVPPTATDTATKPPALETPFTLTPSKTTTPEKETYETSWQDDERFRTITQKELIRIGSLLFEYTPIMQPETSETFYLKVHIPQEYASADPLSFERISLPSNHPNNPDNLSYYTTSVLVYPIIAAQLESTDFRILPVDKESTKVLDVTEPGSSVEWKWVVQAPAASGKHTLALSIFIDRIPDPSWTGSFTIDVRPPAATAAVIATATPTPAPTVLQEFGEDLKNNFTGVLTWTLGLLLPAIAGLTIKYLRRLDMIKKLQEEREALKHKRAEVVLVNELEDLMRKIKELEEKIQQLKSISWWQFWK